MGFTSSFASDKHTDKAVYWSGCTAQKSHLCEVSGATYTVYGGLINVTQILANPRTGTDTQTHVHTKLLNGAVAPLKNNKKSDLSEVSGATAFAPRTIFVLRQTWHHTRKAA